LVVLLVVVDCDNCGVGEVTDPVEEFESLYVVLGDEQLDERIDKLINKVNNPPASWGAS
jgi:hypothetical protein